MRCCLLVVGTGNIQQFYIDTYEYKHKLIFDATSYYLAKFLGTNLWYELMMMRHAPISGVYLNYQVSGGCTLLMLILIPLSASVAPHSQKA